MAEMNGIQLLGVDDLDPTAVENLDKRRAAVPEVEKLIDAELQQFMSWWASRRVAPLITDLRRKLEHLANKELALALKGVGEEVQSRLFKNMSERASTMLKEDM